MWSLALRYYIRLNEVFKNKYGRDINNYKEDIKMLINEHYLDGEDKEQFYPIWENFDIDVSRKLEEMSNDDLVFFSTFLSSSQKDDLLLFKYYDEAIWVSNIVGDSDGFLIYNKLLRSFRGISFNKKYLELVGTPFDKFANVGEYGWEENSLENIIKEFSTAKVIEESNKLDGSLQSARWYRNELILTGSGSVCEDNSPPLKEGFDWLRSNDNYVNMVKDNPNDTHIFEWISLADAHIVTYTKEDTGLYLIGIRNSLTGEQYSYKDVVDRANHYGVRTTELYTKTLDELFEDCKKYKSNEKEGFVVKLDNHFIKIKCDDYVSIVKILKMASSMNELIRAMFYDSIDDILAKVPDGHKEFIINRINYIRHYLGCINYIVLKYYNDAPKDTKKDFMVWVQKNVPKNLMAEVINEYTGNGHRYLGYVTINRHDEKIECFKKIKDIEIIMKSLNQPTLNEYLEKK